MLPHSTSSFLQSCLDNSGFGFAKHANMEKVAENLINRLYRMPTKCYHLSMIAQANDRATYGMTCLVEDDQGRSYLRSLWRLNKSSFVGVSKHADLEDKVWWIKYPHYCYELSMSLTAAWIVFIEYRSAVCYPFTHSAVCYHLDLNGSLCSQVNCQNTFLVSILLYATQTINRLWEGAGEQDKSADHPRCSRPGLCQFSQRRLGWPWFLTIAPIRFDPLSGSS